MITEEEFDLLLKAGKIAAEARDYGAKLIRPGESVLKICEEVEDRIIRAGAKPSFPCNLSINEEAAHYSPVIGDERTVPEGALVKLDIGAQIEGYIVDTAITVSLDESLNPLRQASADALNSAISNLKPGVNAGEIGGIIERIIKMGGFRPIRNLGGHLIKRYELHAGVFIPNVFQRTSTRISEGETYAIEPFATDGAGEVLEDKRVTIYAVRNTNPKRLSDVEKEMIRILYERFNRLPFSERWIRDLGQPEELRQRLKALASKGALYSYPVLMERGKGLVSQFEHTIIIRKGEVFILTK